MCIDISSEINTLFCNCFPLRGGNYYDAISKEDTIFNNTFHENYCDNFFFNEDKILNDYEQRKENLNNYDISNFAQNEYVSFPLNKDESKISKETNLTGLISYKPKMKRLFEVKKEIPETHKTKSIKEPPPVLFPEKSINIIIDKFYNAKGESIFHWILILKAMKLIN